MPRVPEVAAGEGQGAPSRGYVERLCNPATNVTCKCLQHLLTIATPSSGTVRALHALQTVKHERRLSPVLGNGCICVQAKCLWQCNRGQSTYVGNCCIVRRAELGWSVLCQFRVAMLLLQCLRCTINPPWPLGSCQLAAMAVDRMLAQARVEGGARTGVHDSEQRRERSPVMGIGDTASVVAFASEIGNRCQGNRWARLIAEHEQLPSRNGKVWLRELVRHVPPDGTKT